MWCIISITKCKSSWFESLKLVYINKQLFFILNSSSWTIPPPFNRMTRYKSLFTLILMTCGTFDIQCGRIVFLPIKLAPNLWHCFIGNTYPLENYTWMYWLYINYTYISSFYCSIARRQNKVVQQFVKPLILFLTLPETMDLEVISESEPLLNYPFKIMSPTWHVWIISDNLLGVEKKNFCYFSSWITQKVRNWPSPNLHSE